MSRLEKKIITVPSGVTVQASEDGVVVQGPKGKLVQTFSPELDIESKDDQVKVKGDLTRKYTKAQVGLAFALIQNMIKGVTDGYSKELTIIGVGYKAQMQGKDINLQIGFSHPVLFTVPEGIKVQLPKPTQIIIEGIDKQQVGDIAAQIRLLYPPEPYKGKGIRYKDEYVRRKLGKAATK